MARRWTFDEDRFLHAYFDAVGDFIGEHDFHRPKGAATARVLRLKKNGGWAALTDMQAARDRYHQSVGSTYPDEPDFI